MRPALIRNSNGDLCGTTAAGGLKNYGTVFCYAPASAALAVIKQLSPMVGTNPNQLVAGANTLMYGSTGEDGPAAEGFGTVFVAKP